MERLGFYYAVVEAETPKYALRDGASLHPWLAHYKAYLLKNPNLCYTEQEALDLMFFDVKNLPRKICRCFGLGPNKFFFFAKKTEHYSFQQHLNAFKDIRIKLRESQTITLEDFQTLDFITQILEKSPPNT